MVFTPITDVAVVFEALEAWINQRPGLDPRDYGIETEGGRAAYRSEVRQIGKDRTRALKALDESRGLEPRPDLLADAFSGRLEWIPANTPVPHMGVTAQGKLNYTTGQYWPTEYRKAAAAVLESYISAWRQAEAASKPQMFTYHTIADVKAANQAIGAHFFDRSSMKFFKSRIESGLIGGKRFIMSEQGPDNVRRYSIREAQPDGTIDTIGEFQQFRTREAARECIAHDSDYLKAMAKGAV